MPFLSRLLGALIILAVIQTAWAKPEPVLPPAKKTTNPVISTTDSNEFQAEQRKPITAQCTATNSLQKTLLVTAFPRLKPESANAGALEDAEHSIPALLSESLANHRTAFSTVKLDQALPAASLSNDQLLAQQIQRLARDQGTQLVLSGEIVDMSMARPDATYNPGLFTRFVNGTFDLVHLKNHFDKRDRLFSFEINLRDGFTGQSLFRKRYDTYGIWGETKAVGFASPQFWKSDYGQQIKGLVKKASRELGDVIQCQPYIAQIDSRPGQTQVLLQGGSNNGLHRGDTMALYQLVVQGSETEYAQYKTRIVNRNAAIELQEVYPSHSVGVISGTTYLTGQFLAVVP